MCLYYYLHWQIVISQYCIDNNGQLVHTRCHIQGVHLLHGVRNVVHTMLTTVM